MFELNLVIYHRVKLQRHRRYKFCERKQIQLFELLPLKPLDDFLKCFTYLRNQRRIWRLKLWFKICFYWTVTEMSFRLGKKGFIETVRWQLRWDRNSSCFVVLIVLGKCFCISNISAFVSCCFEVKKWWRCFSRGLFVLLFLFFQASNEEVKGPGMSMKLLQQHQGVLMEKKPLPGQLHWGSCALLNVTQWTSVCLFVYRSRHLQETGIACRKYSRLLHLNYFGI